MLKSLLVSYYTNLQRVSNMCNEFHHIRSFCSHPPAAATLARLIALSLEKNVYVMHCTLYLRERERDEQQS
jgi:hypothetical protein